MPGNANCPSCGLPRFLNRKLVWTTDGGLYFQSKRSDRLIFLEEDDISTVLDVGVKLHGHKLLDTLRECRRGFTRRQVASQLNGIRGFLLRHWPLAKRVVRSALRDASFFGCGSISISELKPRKYMTIKARHPYHHHLLAGDIWGFWEGLYGVEALLSLNASSEQEWEITVRTVQRNRFEETREKAPRRPERDFGLEVCEKCHLPLYPWELHWDTELGTIYQARTHRHMIITSAEGWRLILNEIKGSSVKDLPPDIGMALAVKEAAEYRMLKANNYKTAYRHFFLSLPFLGWGKPRRVSRKPFLIDAEMEGVPFPQFLAWKMAGVYEALEKEPADIKHEKAEDEQWRYMVSPRLEGSFLEIRSMVPEADGDIYPRPLMPF
jgi:hypothetical protein